MSNASHLIRRVFRPTVLGLALVLALAAALPFFTTAFSGEEFQFEVTMSVSERGFAQLFYDTGSDFNERQSVTRSVVPGEPMKLQFPIAGGSFRRLRFDPHNGAARIEIRDARVTSNRTGTRLTFSPAEFGTIAGITDRAERDGALALQAGVDASLMLAPDSPPKLQDETVRYRYAVVPFALALAAALVLYGAAGTAAAARAGARARDWARANPRRAIAVAATLTVLVGCHPVIFFGRSFVSPDNATLMLYDSFPVLPGYKSAQQENARGSDVGAMMWWHVMAPAITYDALFRDHELPLWNRYQQDGLPFLGQGQTMVGDPLNMLAIVTRSAAWAWDVRFVLSRWLLCAGIGLTAWVLLRELFPALLVTVGAGFLGYFGFRLNHAANFSVAYGPWILLAWAGLSAADSRRSEARWALLLVAASVAEICSGTVKEAYMTLVVLHFAGLLVVLLQHGRRGLRKIAFASAAGVLVALLCAPLIVSFLSALQRSATNYDNPAAAQINPAYLITFFEDLFSRQTYPHEDVSTPATNFLFLAGIAWALAAARDLPRRRTALALALAALVPFGIVFGFVPARWIVTWPFVKNIIHVDNTFSCPLMILAGVIAAYGLSALRRQAGTHGWWTSFALYLAGTGLLLGIYFSATQTVQKSDFFSGYAGALVIALVCLPVGIHLAARAGDRALLVLVLTGCGSLFLWRHSQYLEMPFDDYVFNPQVRADLHPVSPAVQFVDSKMDTPSRPIGLGLNLFAGYNEMLRWETPLGFEPLRSRLHDELAKELGLVRVADAASPMPEDAIQPLLPALDSFNVRFYLAGHSEKPREIPGLRRLGSFDLDVYESPGTWPRAYFTDRIHVYSTPRDLAARIRRADGHPFAAVQQGDATIPNEALRLRNDLAGGALRPARDYRLTTNTTTFTVEAPGPGVIVLNEGWDPDELAVTINGVPASYFRVNHNSRAVYVPAAGAYTVRYAFWPAHFTAALVAFGLGLAALLAALAAAFRPASIPSRQYHGAGSAPAGDG